MAKTVRRSTADRPAHQERSARAKRLDFADRIAARLISLGGVTIVLSVIAIILFVGAGALPLLKGATASDATPGYTQPAIPLLQLVDEYRERVSHITSAGDLVTGSLVQDSPADPDVVSLTADATCAATSIDERIAVLGHADGSITIFDCGWRVTYADGRQIEPRWEQILSVSLSDTLAIKRVEIARDEDGGITVVAQTGHNMLRAYTYDPEWEEEQVRDLPALPDEPPGVTLTDMSLTSDGRRLAVGWSDGRFSMYALGLEDAPELAQLTSAADTAITALSFLLGDQTLIIGDASGEVTRWLPIQPQGFAQRNYQAIFSFEPHGSAIVDIVPSMRDKGFITVDAGGSWRLHHATAQKTYLRIEAQGAAVAQLSYAPKADGVIATLTDGRVLGWDLDNPHPEATLGTLFGKVWYEGYNQPEYVWQSTGGTDEFEPKLSLIPLLFGTMKGTLYAMLFSIPVAILAAIYVSQLAQPRFRTTVKPAIELMAAIPSVVVGFLAALWLAPIIEQHLIATGLILFAIPLFAVLAASAWHLVPARLRDRMPNGIEPAVALPFIALGIYVAVSLAPGVEAMFFEGDFRQWLFSDMGIRFDPRNNIVVGFALGIAVIPIIFTVSEDALSNVPGSLVSGALALGASRWQATWRIVLRAASPGIFAAIMLGFGRAVGETMIVLMATGNTPIMDWSIFNGMRTMSAAIAVEIPEAPQGGTLYRVLFLTAFLLFILTLAVNTVASTVGTRLRKRYGRF